MSHRLPSSLPRFRCSFELYLTSDKLHHFGVETAEALHSWTRSIGKVGVCPATVLSPLALRDLMTVLSGPSGGDSAQLSLPADAGV